MRVINTINKFYDLILSDRRRVQVERFILFVAILAFILHFSLLLAAGRGWLPEFFYPQGEVVNPIITLYTPFSIILLYEVFLLIYYLPQSITIYLGKQYEVMVLILVRKVFEDLAELSVTVGEWTFDEIKELLFTLGAILLLFLLIFFFYRLGECKYTRPKCETITQWRFVASKKVLSLILLVIFITLFVQSLINFSHLPLTLNSFVYMLNSINKIFFSSFFTALILIEVLLLLFTFNITDKFNKVIRNSGFIISTILLKISFSTTGMMSTIIIIVAVLFGILILGIYRLFEKKLPGRI